MGKTRDEGTRRGVPSWGETRSGGAVGSHFGLGPDLSPVVRPISHSYRELREPGRGSPPGGSIDLVVLGIPSKRYKVK